MTLDPYRLTNTGAWQVEVRHGRNGNGGSKRAYKVKGLTTRAADEAEFDNDQEGTRMTVAAYFQQAYGIA